jgi:hypothetical protein
MYIIINTVFNNLPVVFTNITANGEAAEQLREIRCFILSGHVLCELVIIIVMIRETLVMTTMFVATTR